MHLAELDVDRLNVREVHVDHLVVSAMDTANLQVAHGSHSGWHNWHPNPMDSSIVIELNDG